MASNRNNCSRGDYCVRSKWISGRFRAVRAIVSLMCQEEKKDKIKLAEGLSNGRVPRCVTTAFTASNHDPLKLVTS